MTGVIVESKALVSLDRFHGALGRGDIKGDLGGMDFQTELNPLALEGIENRLKALGKVLIAGLNHVRRRRRERVEQMPDGAAREPVDHLDTQLLGRLGRVDNLLGRSLADAFRLTVTPNILRQNRLVTLVDVVAYRLARQMG